MILLLIETGSHFAAQAGLELHSLCLRLQSAGIAGQHHRVLLATTGILLFSFLYVYLCALWEERGVCVRV